MNEKYIKIFIENIPSVKTLFNNNNNNINNNKIEIISFKKFEYSNKKFILIKLKNFLICETVHNFFQNPIKKFKPSLNSKNEKINAFLSFDILELTKSYWYGVIIRNLPPCSLQELEKFLSDKKIKGIKYCVSTKIINNSSHGLIVMNELEDAENLCMKLNGEKIQGAHCRKLKVNFHSQICKIRRNVKKSYFEIYHFFNENGYIFESKIEQSEKMVECNINIREFFNINYGREKKMNESDEKENYNNNGGFNNDGKKEEGEIKSNNYANEKKDNNNKNKENNEAKDKYTNFGTSKLILSQILSTYDTDKINNKTEENNNNIKKEQNNNNNISNNIMNALTKIKNNKSNEKNKNIEKKK